MPTRLTRSVCCARAASGHAAAAPPSSVMNSRRVLIRSLRLCVKRNASDTVIPMALAVLRLMASSNFVGCSMGRSCGCLPCKIFCTNLAPCRNDAGPSAPNGINPPISTNTRVVDAAGRPYLIAKSVSGLIAKLPSTTSASACSVFIVEKAPSRSSGPRTITTGCISMPVGRPAMRTSSSIALA
jgi:hypothetical protein